MVVGQNLMQFGHMPGGFDGAHVQGACGPTQMGISPQPSFVTALTQDEIKLGWGQDLLLPPM
jgi:hypothetical protein